MNLNYQMDHIQYQIFKIILSIFLKNTVKVFITKDKNGENVPHLEIVELVLTHCNIVNNNYMQNSRILYTFVSNKP